jgi:DNA-directed RNA polymerase specialized sigma24 family protein
LCSLWKRSCGIQARVPRCEHRMLTMAGEFRSEVGFRISPIDRLGRTIDPAVLDAAEKIGQRAIAFAEKLVVDPAVATNLLEESAAAVSRVLRTKRSQNGAPIRDLQAYLFRAFIRRINKISSRTPILGNPDRAKVMDFPVSEDFELRILVDEFLMRCDSVTRDMFYRRIQGFSWREISKVYGISAHAAESRFSQALQRVRKQLGLKG